MWSAAWDAVRDAELPAAVYVDVCAAGLPIEDNVRLFADVAHYALAFAIGCYLPPEQRPAARARINAACRIALDGSEPGSGRQLAAARAVIQSSGPADAAMLRAWLDAGAAPDGLVLDSDLRWVIVLQLAVLGLASAADVDAEDARDRTATSAINAAKAHASRPDAAAKAAAWSKIVDDDSLSNHLVWATAEGFWQVDQDALTASYVDRFVVDMPIMAARRAPQVAERLMKLAYPSTVVEPGALAALTAMADQGGLAPVLARLVRDGNDDLERALAARRLATVHGSR